MSMGGLAKKPVGWEEGWKTAAVRLLITAAGRVLRLYNARLAHAGSH